MKKLPVVWHTPTNMPLFSKNEVHVWCADLCLAGEHIELLQQVLSVDERERADRFHLRRHKRRYTVGRGFLRNLLGQYLDKDPRSIEFSYSSRGKPSLKQQPVRRNLYFNVSHSQELVLYAIASKPLVGIDVEHIRLMSDVENMAKRYFFSNEYNRIVAMKEEDEKSRAFFNYWTCKEAYLKATGEGISGLDKIEVSLASSGKISLKNESQDPSEKRDWLVTQISPKREYSAALVINGKDWKLKYFNYMPSTQWKSSKRRIYQHVLQSSSFKQIV